MVCPRAFVGKPDKQVFHRRILKIRTPSPKRKNKHFFAVNPKHTHFFYYFCGEII